MHVCGWIAGGGGSLSLSKFQYKDFLRRAIVEAQTAKKKSGGKPDLETVPLSRLISRSRIGNEF
jgi:hypothetical protein